jgi:hypothetical protein
MVTLAILSALLFRLWTFPFDGEAVSIQKHIMVDIFLAACTTLAFRGNRRGLFVSELGVRNRTLWSTKTLPWQDIAMFEIRAVDRPFGWPAYLRISAISIVPRIGQAIQADVLYVEPHVPPWHTEARVRDALLELEDALARSRRQ